MNLRRLAERASLFVCPWPVLSSATEYFRFAFASVSAGLSHDGASWYCRLRDSEGDEDDENVESSVTATAVADHTDDEDRSVSAATIDAYPDDDDPVTTTTVVTSTTTRP
ncbi:MAG: hypothetical protein BMS9Abin20_1092 [Acidimicrobiia bacterium]|nr:MAG: hypothetical protein BMS9Abin20_1092 [Acidimicrobiia bacterium]